MGARARYFVRLSIQFAATLTIAAPAAALTIRTVAVTGDVAPATGGRVFESFSGPLINDAGDVLLRGFLDTGTGLFLGDGTSLGKVLASGDAAPGTDLGLGDASFAGFTDYALNEFGEVAFTATAARLIRPGPGTRPAGTSCCRRRTGRSSSNRS